MANNAAEKKQQKVSAILDAAENIFLGKPYNLISVDEIALAAGVTKKTLYSYFPSKLSLFVKLLEKYIQELHRLCLQAVDREPRLDQALRDVFDTLFQFTRDNEKFMRFFWAMDVDEMEGEIPAEISANVRMWNRGMIDLVSGVIRKAQERGIIRPEVDPELFIHMVSAFNKGILVHTNKQIKWNVADIKPAELMEGFYALVFKSIFTDPPEENGSSAK